MTPDPRPVRAFVLPNYGHSISPLTVMVRLPAQPTHESTRH